MTGTVNTENQLREALDVLANGVHAAPDAYRQAQSEWRRRERRRRLILAILIAIVFILADILGLWALNHASNDPHIIFNEPTPVHQEDPADRLGPP